MNTHRLFVFDMDGVLVASEKTWEETEPRFLEELFGLEIAQHIGDCVGVSIGEIYQKAIALGAAVKRQTFDRLYDETAKRVYAQCEISADTDRLVAHLVANNWTLALLSSSPMRWINQVVVRLPWRDKLAAVLSLNEHHELRPKPAPDGYRFLLKELDASPKSSVALEDSNPGIASARAAGFFTIGYREHLPAGYVQDAADATAENMQDVLAIITRDIIITA